MRLIIVIIILLSSNLLFSQRVVKGIVIDENKEEVIFATIIEDGTKNGTITDIDGRFELKTQNNNTVLEVSSWGCKKKEFKIFSDTILKVNITCDVDMGEYSNEPAIGEKGKKWFSSIDETDLTSYDVCENCNSYRFSKLSTFQNPICIRLDKSGSDYQLTYTIGKGLSGYNPNGIKKKRTKKISEKEWNYYVFIFEGINFDTVSNVHYEVMLDGTNWIFERKLDGIYKGHSTNVSKEKFILCGQYLIELAGINEKIYERFKKPVFLDKENKIVHRKEILQLLIKQINEYRKSNPPRSESCKRPYHIVEIKKNGKLKKVSSETGNGALLDFLFYFEDKECRNYYKKALEKIDLAELNLKDSIAIYLTANYNEKTSELEVE